MLPSLGSGWVHRNLGLVQKLHFNGKVPTALPCLSASPDSELSRDTESLPSMLSISQPLAPACRMLIAVGVGDGGVGGVLAASPYVPCGAQRGCTSGNRAQSPLTLHCYQYRAGNVHPRGQGPDFMSVSQYQQLARKLFLNNK